MEELWILILVAFFVTNSLDKAESVKVKLEETPLKTFDKIFGEGWWDKDEAEDLKTPPTNFGQNVHHQIDRQNTQIGQIEPNSTDQNPPLTESDHSGQIEPNSTDQNPPLTESDHSGQIEPKPTDQNAPLTESDHSGQIEPNSTDQNPPLTESDHSGQIEPNSTDQNPPLTESDHSGQIEPNSTDQNPPLTVSDYSDKAKNGEEISSNKNIAEDKQKRKIIAEFHAIKDEFNQKGKHSKKEWNQIDGKIANHLKVSRSKIYKWKKELGLSQKRKIHNIEEKKVKRKHLVEKFDQRKAELKRNGFKNSYHREIDETVSKELGITDRTIYAWKRELGLGQTRPTYSNDEKLKIVKKLMQMESEQSGESKKLCKEINTEIVERFGVNVCTINQWKKEFGLSRRNPKPSEQKELMKLYYEIKDQNPKNTDEDLVKKLKIGKRTLYRWKKQFKRQQLHPNSVDEHLVEENAAANVQEIGIPNSSSI